MRLKMSPQDGKVEPTGAAQAQVVAEEVINRIMAAVEVEVIIGAMVHNVATEEAAIEEMAAVEEVEVEAGTTIDHSMTSERKATTPRRATMLL